MRSLILKTFALFLILGSADAIFADEFNYEKDLKHFYIEADKEKHQAIANYFGYSLKPNCPQLNHSNTSIIQYCKFGSTLCHIGWYSDGCIITYMNGKTRSKQVVIYNNKIIGNSNKYEGDEKGYYIHKHIWGEIDTYPNVQGIYFNKDSIPFLFTDLDN